MFSVSLLQERFSHFTMRTMKTDLCTGENDESDENDENATWTDENKIMHSFLCGTKTPILLPRCFLVLRAQTRMSEH